MTTGESPSRNASKNALALSVARSRWGISEGNNPRRLASDRDGHARPVDGGYLGNAPECEGAIATAANLDRSWSRAGDSEGEGPAVGENTARAQQGGA